MQNRFGLKDAVLILLAVAILVSVWVGIWGFDRQWQTVKQLDEQLDEQRDAIVRLESRLERGVAITTSPSAGQESAASAQAGSEDATSRPDSFARILAPRDNEDFAFGDWYVDAFAQAVGKLTPLVPSDAYQNRIEGYVLESLIVRDPETLEWLPWIARDWQVSEDGLTYTFDLREDVVFADGEPLTSEDVVFTYELITNPDINAPQLQSYYAKVSDVRAVGPHRVIFEMSEPYFMSLSISGGMRIMPKHWYEKFSPEEYNTLPGLLFGSGPYRLEGDPETWQPDDQQIALVRNQRYWGPRPVFDRLVWKTIPDPTAEQVSFINGEVDRFGVPPDQYDRLKDKPALKKQGELYRFDSVASSYSYIGWNQRRDGEPTIFADKRVRQAMTMLIHREEMIEQILSGLASVVTGPFPPASNQSNPDVEPWPHDPERAKTLLAEAGITDTDGDGVLEKPGGDDFVVTLVYPAQNPTYRQLALYYKDALAVGGVTLELRPTEWNTMLQRIDERDFDAITLAWSGGVQSDPKQIFHSDSMDDGGHNFVSYRNEELDRLIDQARVTIDPKERQELWHRVHAILHEDQPYTFLYTREAVLFLDDRFRNVEVTNLGLNDRIEYYVPTPEQRWGD